MDDHSLPPAPRSPPSSPGPQHRRTASAWSFTLLLPLASSLSWCESPASPSSRQRDADLASRRKLGARRVLRRWLCICSRIGRVRLCTAKFYRCRRRTVPSRVGPPPALSPCSKLTLMPRTQRSRLPPSRGIRSEQQPRPFRCRPCPSVHPESDLVVWRGSCPGHRRRAELGGTHDPVRLISLLKLISS